MRERGASMVAVVVLILVIVVAGVFVVRQLMGGRSGASGGAAASLQRDLYCLGCKQAFQAEMPDEEYTPLMMAGPHAQPKATCPTCSKAQAIAGTKCAGCGEVVPHPGRMAMDGGRPYPCPKCKEPVFARPAPGTQ